MTDITKTEQSKELVIESDDRKRIDYLTDVIKVNVKIVENALYMICKSISEVKCDKLYKLKGYSSFESYCEQEIGIKRHQGLKYALIGENLSENFVDSNQQIGVTKLHLLAQIDESERQEITQNTDLESTSVKELKVKIKSLEETNRKTCEHSKELEKQVRELKDRPVREITVEDTTKIHELEEQLRQEQEKYQSELVAVRKELSENRNQSLATFNAYLTSATNAMERLCDFVSVRMADENINYYKQKIQLLLRCVSSKINLGGD